LSEKRRFKSSRAVLGGCVVGLALATAGVLGGVSVASGSVSAAQAQYGKVTICHHTHSKKHPFVTITISLNAWPAHARQGDTIGPCVTTTTTTTTTTTEPLAPATSPGKSGETHGNAGGNGRGNGHGNGK
jgi:ABC-type sugar transport system substrate-binding protein